MNQKKKGPPADWGLKGVLALLLALLLALCTVVGHDLWRRRPVGEASSYPSAPGSAVSSAAANPRPVLVLDAGHGGRDPGALDARERVRESEINLEMCGRVARLLAAHEGALRVVLTREQDVEMSINERCAIARQNNADLLVSLHLNAEESGSARGFECYPALPGKVFHEQSLAFAEGLVRQAEALDIPLRGSGLHYAFYLGATKVTQDAAEYDGRFEDYDSFGVLERSGCPAVLVEQWYLSSSVDLRSLNNDSGKDKVALCIYRAICGYFELTPLHDG